MTGQDALKKDKTAARATATVGEDVQPARLPRLEISLYVTVWLGAVVYAICCVYTVSQGEHFQILPMMCSSTSASICKLLDAACWNTTRIMWARS